MKRLLPVCVMILCLICSGFTAAEHKRGTVPCLTEAKTIIFASLFFVFIMHAKL